MILTILVAGLAVFGGIFLLWTAADGLFAVLPKNSCHVFYLSGEDGQIEQQIRTCLRLQAHGKLRGRLIFADCGLSAEAQITAQLLLKNNRGVLCAPSQIKDYIGWEKEIIGAGTGTD